MRTLSKLFSGVIAAATIVSSVSITASAYDVCDVNQDGKVNIRDVSAISRYLSGYSRCKQKPYC